MNLKKVVTSMKTFISKFLELAEINTPSNEQWNWKPAGEVQCALWGASTTCCGCTREYGGGTDIGSDDND